MIALALVAALGTSVVDRTLSCPVLETGAAYESTLDATVVTRPGGAHFRFWATPQTYFQPAVQASLDVEPARPTLAWDGRHVCTPAPHLRLTLAPTGLRKEATVTTRWMGSQSASCRTSGRIVFRARVTMRNGKAAAVRLVAVDSRSRAPLVYTAWTPTTIVTYLRPGCEASP